MLKCAGIDREGRRNYRNGIISKKREPRPGKGDYSGNKKENSGVSAEKAGKDLVNQDECD